jgi:hypothetical protein
VKRVAEERAGGGIDKREATGEGRGQVEDQIVRMERWPDLIFAQDELNRLEDASRRNRLRVNELEDERSSFRKKVGRTMAIAIGRITRR